MPDHICPSCKSPNPSGASFCFSCREPLTLTQTLTPVPHANRGLDATAPAPVPAPVVSVAVPSWRLDRFSTRPIDREPQARAPASPAPEVTEPSPWIWGHTDVNTDTEAATLLKLLDIADSAAASWLPVPLTAATAATVTTLPALMPGPPAAPVSAHQARKAQQRAFVRRVRLARDGPAPPALGTVQHVLVLDKDAVARVELCALLEGFGFRAHPARTATQAQALLDLHQIAAAFLAVALDGSDADADEAAALCQRISPCALIIVGSAARPVERVRAKLAGADEFLAKPASRGGLARALDACGVALPADPRRAAP